MKKQSFALGLLLLARALSVAEEQRPIDLVVVLDTSSSMHASYRDVSEYAIGPMLKEFLRVGDTFHLIGFSGAPRAEISRRIEGLGDVETIIGRMLLMYPLDPYSDVIAALEYVSRYLSDLPDTRPKTIVFISDGEHAPPPSSTYAELTPEMVKVRLAETAARLKGNGWTFHFLRVPFMGDGSLIPLPGISSSRPTAPSRSGPTDKGSDEKSESRAKAAPDEGSALPSSGTPSSSAGESAESRLDVSDAVADLLAAPVIDWSAEDSEASIRATIGAIAVDFPKDIGKSDRSLSIPLSVRNLSPKPVYLETQSVLVDGVDRMAKRSFRELGPRSESTLKIRVNLPSDFPVGRAEIQVEPIFTGSLRISPQSGSIAVEIVEAPFGRFFSAALPAILFAVGLAIAAILALLVIILSRRLSSAPGRAAASAPSHTGIGSDTRAVRDLSHPRAVSEANPPSERSEALSAFPSPGKESVPVAAQLSRSETIRVPTDDAAALLASFAKRTADDEASRGGARLEVNEKRAETLVHRPVLETHTLFPPTERAVTKNQKVGTGVAARAYGIRKPDTRIMLSLFVEDQNTLIGKRNIHLLKAGSSLSLGGGSSDFLVFLVPVPRRIADIHFDGERCIFVPRRPDFFPDIGSETIEDCVGKTIRVVSLKGYELKIRLDRFEDPLASLNRFLHSIEVPGR